MIVTHVEASKKVCPHLNKSDRYGSASCISDGCMMWRNTGEEHKGYCGLAGVPVEVNVAVKS